VVARCSPAARPLLARCGCPLPAVGRCPPGRDVRPVGRLFPSWRSRRAGLRAALPGPGQGREARKSRKSNTD
jgi:hypothetical protein